MTTTCDSVSTETVMHTPGPWTIDKRTGLDVMGPDGKDVCVALCQEMGGMLFDKATIGPEKRQQAFDNACLIAAAPEMLAKLQELNTAISNGLGGFIQNTLMHVELGQLIAKAGGK